MIALGDSVTTGGCGLKCIATKIKEHCDDKNTRSNKLGIRLIGAQAIALARYSLRIVDQIKDIDDTPTTKMQMVVLSKICQKLRNIGTFMNSVSTSNAAIQVVKSSCKIYFNLYALFFTQFCNSTVWTLGYVVPYHAEKLWEDYKVGYGIISMQGKEAKHSALKTDLKLSSNRSNAQDGTGKWHQIARSSFVRNFYLPYHFPIDTYTPHSDSRNPPVTTRVCGCFRPLSELEDVCTECIKGLNIVETAEIGSLTNIETNCM